jgi:hypothetical protein
MGLVKGADRYQAQGYCSVPRLVALLLFAIYFTWLYVWERSRDHRRAEHKHARRLAQAVTAEAEAAEAVAFTGTAPWLHGTVHKAGTLPQDRWHPRHAVEMGERFSSWIKDRKPFPTNPTLAPTVAPSCAVWAVSASWPVVVPCTLLKQRFCTAEPCLQGHLCQASQSRLHIRSEHFYTMHGATCQG